MGPKHIGATTLTFQGHMTLSIIRFAICPFLLVSYLLELSIYLQPFSRYSAPKTRAPAHRAPAHNNNNSPTGPGAMCSTSQILVR